MLSSRNRTALLAIALAMPGCPATPSPTRFSNLGELHDAIDEARRSSDATVRRDTDDDGIPDGIELDLDTDETVADSDRDGLVDNAELFGIEGDFDRAAPIPDADHDGVIAPIDDDDDGDGLHDGAFVDSDGDGIANYLEYYGYSYDWLTGTFVAWDGDPLAEHYRTDPLQVSTDQDAYSDAMEVTGVGLDVTVLPPGNHPLVPAVPDLYLDVLGYSVTLNEDITYGENHTLANETTWNRELEETHSYTTERSWDAGLEIGVTGGMFHFVAHANYGESYASTQGTSTTIALGGSALDSREWSRARTSNPTDAAHLKLFVRLHNVGDAPVSTVVPTLTLRVGGLNVDTFEPGDGQANMLVPGGRYPEDPSVAWVIDAVDVGVPLSLTMRELRALENGAPLAVSVTQVLGEVMRLDEDESWQSVGDVNQYLARCDAVSANVTFDLGDRGVVQHLVYAGTAESGVPVTVGDALALLGVDGAGVLHYADRRGDPQTASLDGYAFVVDQNTLRRNGWVLDEAGGPATPPDGAVIDEVRLHPGSSVLVRAPREVAGAGGPAVHYAYADAVENEVRVCVTDYQGIASVVVHNEEGDQSLELTEDLAGTCFYSALDLAGRLPLGEAALFVTATNLAGETVEHPVETLWADPGPQRPTILQVRFDVGSRYVYANVESGAPSDPNSEIEWVRVYHPGLPFVEMTSVPNAYEDPNGYSVTLPSGFAATDIQVVAYVAAGVYARYSVGAGDVVRPLYSGRVTMHAGIDTTGIDEEWTYATFDLDTSEHLGYFYEADDWSSTLNPVAPVDLWTWVDEGPTGWVLFNATYARVTAGTDFDALTRDEVSAYVPSETASLPLGRLEGLQIGDILAIRTTSGRYAKLRVVSLPSSDDGWTNLHIRDFVFDYLVWP